MPSPDTPWIRAHEDATLFREAVTFTAARTGFAARLIEKDYFCSVVLQYLAIEVSALVFKGGTCLAKVHSGFYRLSEDLDYSIPMEANASRAERSRAAKQVREVVARISDTIAPVSAREPLHGANKSTQYLATLAYASLLDGHTEPIKLEIGLREPLLKDQVTGRARTLLLDPISGDALVPAFPLACISPREAMAEKVRAALARLVPAIRDFYDLDHAYRHGQLAKDDRAFIALVRRKLAVVGTGPVDVSPARREKLRGQIATDLQPVLQPAAFMAFDLDRAFDVASQVLSAVEAMDAR